MSVKKSFSIFVIIVVLSIVGVLFCSIDASTFAMLGDANPSLLACAAALVVLMWFLDAFPGLIERIPNKYVASLLGMTPVTLSRLRSELREEKGARG